MSGHDFDLFVIGAGSGGVRAARMAAQTGARVAIAEFRELGGTCVNLGCVPKKIFSYAAHFRHDFSDSSRFGWTSEVRGFDWPTLRDNKNAEIARLNGIYQRLLDNAGVQTVVGRAKVTGPHTVEVEGQSFTAERILVAVGGAPEVPSFPGSEYCAVSDHVFHLETLPERAAVLGGGYIGVELGGILASFGVDVTLIHRGDLVLRGFDEDVRSHLSEELAKGPMKVRLSTTVTQVEKTEDGLHCTLSDGTTLDVDFVLAALGRRPVTPGLGLGSAGVEVDATGAIKVDDEFRTTCPSIYALGDVIDRVTLTPVAIYEAMALVQTLFGDAPRIVDYDNIPSAVFSMPPVGTVGLSESQAKDKHGEVRVFESRFRPMKHTIGGRDTKSYMKVIVAADTDVVVGMHMVGDDAPEIMQGFAAAMKCGMTKAQLDSTVGIHPTAAEELVTMRTERN